VGGRIRSFDLQGEREYKSIKFLQNRGGKYHFEAPHMCGERARIFETLIKQSW
jgi:hypothetical protein